MFDEALSWDGARQHCIGLGGRLLEVRTQEELDRAAQLRVQQQFSPWMWIGGRYDSARGEWIWISNSEAVNLTLFLSMDMLDLEAQYGGCLVMYGGRNLANDDCNSVSRFACDFVYN